MFTARGSTNDLFNSGAVIVENSHQGGFKMFPMCLLSVYEVLRGIRVAD
jgi:hypothetical protein